MILIVGDAGLDIHITGTTTRLNPEAPVPVVDFKDEQYIPGMAANVAAHFVSANIKCSLVCKCTREDCMKKPEWIQFHQIMCNNHIVVRPNHTIENIPLTTKTRIWSGQQICRVDREDVQPPPRVIEREWITNIYNIIHDFKITIVLFVDYNKGALTDRIINQIAIECRKRKILTILDPKRPTFINLKNVDIIKPNVREVESTNRTAAECSKELGHNTYLVNTLGKDGVAVYRDGELLFTEPTEAKEVTDVCGAGDSYASLMAIAYYKGMGLSRAVLAANKAAALTIQHRGCYVPSFQEIERCLNV